MSELQLGPVSLERMVRPVERVRDRLRRVTAAMNDANSPYAVVGKAVAAWVSRPAFHRTLRRECRNRNAGTA